jgi:hypothetical protein
LACHSLFSTPLKLACHSLFSAIPSHKFFHEAVNGFYLVVHKISLDILRYPDTGIFTNFQ